MKKNVEKKIISLLMLVALTMTAMANTPIPTNLDRNQLLGIWKDTTTHNGILYTSYINYKPDKTFEYLYTYTLDSTLYFVCQDGEYYIKGSVIYAFENLRYRIFTEHNGQLRIVSAYIKKNLGTITERVTELSDKHMTVVTLDGRTKNFNKLLDKPAEWKPEFFEPETPLTEKSLVTQWNLVNYFKQKDKNFQFFYVPSPELRGLQLNANHQIAYGHFWAFWVTNMLHRSGDMADDETAYIMPEDTEWRLNNNSIILSCSKYYTPKIDFVGNKTEAPFVIPVKPFTEDFTIISCTDHYMIWYNAFDDIYMTFARINPNYKP